MVTIENCRFSIPQICESGQCFRLDQAGGNAYELVAGDRWLGIEAGKKETVLSCSEEEYKDFWQDYFDLGTDYDSYLKQISREDQYLAEAAEFGSGIRILKQDTWEMIITFILSQQNNIRRIKGLIRVLSERYGRECRKPDGTAYYAFPDVNALASAAEEELRELKLGYRSRYICGSARMIAAGDISLAELPEMEYGRAREELMKLPGIGRKVADCICLFALHQMDAFPVDTHIQKVLDEHYRDGFPFEQYRGCAGVMQQYIFYYDLKGGRK